MACTPRSTHTHHMLPQYCSNYNDLIFTDRIYKKVTLARFSIDSLIDGLHGPKHVGVTVKKCFNVHFNILYVK